ncbi:T9SS type A sorting domain-containing protein [bacterium]|nr:T9SS type A sorting domain-containing protein [bacterium]
MKGIRAAIIIISLITVYTFCLEINNGWHIIDGQKFFIKGIGYETHTRPGQVPWEYQFNPELIRLDLQHIKDAGFNTIRTWGALSKEELQLVQESSLKILFGIWIDPHGDYGDPTFIYNTFNHVTDVLTYSKNFSCIIGYLIMNEPLVEDVYNGGPENLITLWQGIINIIQQKHPGIPVSISNTTVGDYIRSDLFQMGAYNLYIYNPVLISSTHGYAGFCEYLKQNRSMDMPFIVTEFGLSVSPGPLLEEYGYGGNTLTQQTDGDLFMYRSMIDGGAQGGCVFQYHDGWWKGGDANTHDNSPEEWFGLIEFDSNPGSDEGTPRPVWNAFAEYNRAIITEPRNQQIYIANIPIELFLMPQVDSFAVSVGETVLFGTSNLSEYYTAKINYVSADSLQDLVLDFRFYNQQRVLLKSESISLLLSKETIVLPSLDLSVIPTDLTSTSQIHIIAKIANNSPFSIDYNRLDYAYFPHVGFAPGEARSTTINLQDGSWSFTDAFSVEANARVVTVGVGFSIRYGEFSRRIYDQKIIFRGDWANAIASKDLIPSNSDSPEIPNHFQLFQNYPNPFNSGTTISYALPVSQRVTITIHNLLGQTIATLVDKPTAAGYHNVHWDAGENPGGIYFVKLQTDTYSLSNKMVLLK